MFTLFNPPYKRMREPIIVPLFEYYVKQTNIECERLFAYYRDNVQFAQSTSMWLKILITLGSYIDLSPDNLVKVVRNNSPRFCGQFGLASPYNSSKIQSPGSMYNRNTHDLFISVEHSVDANVLAAKYTDIRAIEVVSHDFSDFSYGVCNGNYSSEENGIAIFTVDLAMLALQYKMWCEKERYIKERGAYRQTTEFIAKYIWPSIIYSHMDNVLFNRLMNKIKGQPNALAVRRHSFLLVEFGQGFDTQFDLLIDSYKKRPTGWLDRLQAIPSLKKGNYYLSMLYPDTAPTRQIRWAMVLSKLKMLEFVLLTDGYAQNEALNLSERTTIQRELRILLNDRSFELTVPPSYLARIQWCYDQVNQE